MKIVVTEPFPMFKVVRSALEQIGTVIYGPFSSHALDKILPSCDILVVRLGLYIGENVFRSAKDLKYIISATTGLNHIDLEAAHNRNIRIICLRDCPDKIKDISSTAEHAWGLLLALVRTIPAANSHVLNGGWNRDLFWGYQLQGKQLGIIGYGRIGSKVADYGLAFGMRVVAYDVEPAKICPPVRSVSLERLVQNSDIVSIHITADPENYHFINSNIIAKFKSGLFLVNTSRGMVIDSKEIASKIKSGKVAGVAVDVLEGEEFGQLGNDPLLACAKLGHNVLLTPHIGGATKDAITQAELAVISILKEDLSSF